MNVAYRTLHVERCFVFWYWARISTVKRLLNIDWISQLSKGVYF